VTGSTGSAFVHTLPALRAGDIIKRVRFSVLANTGTTEAIFTAALKEAPQEGGLLAVKGQPLIGRSDRLVNGVPAVQLFAAAGTVQHWDIYPGITITTDRPFVVWAVTIVGATGDADAMIAVEVCRERERRQRTVPRPH
jgi:hypothetical protein